ncbi:hypothetical protein HMPREF0004_3925, partial [Achromobacter piechaudii ATCC 43553]
MLKTLVQEGAVEQDLETRRYLIGQEISLLGLARTRRFPLLTLADPYMSELAEQVGIRCFEYSTWARFDLYWQKDG